MFMKQIIKKKWYVGFLKNVPRVFTRFYVEPVSPSVIHFSVRHSFFRPSVRQSVRPSVIPFFRASVRPSNGILVTLLQHVP